MTLAKLSSGAGLGSGIISPGRFSRQGQVFITRLAENITTLDMITRHQMTRGQGLMTRKHETCHAGFVRYYHFFCFRQHGDCNNQTMDDGYANTNDMNPTVIFCIKNYMILTMKCSKYQSLCYLSQHGHMFRGPILCPGPALINE